MEPFIIIKQLLELIEKQIRGKVTVEDLAKTLYISEVHLQRLFKFTFSTSIATYIRSRKLQVALDMVLNSELNIDEIAYELGFSHESSFIRSFKREFGKTPRDIRKSPKIIEVMPPLSLVNYKGVTNGILSKVDIVMLPEFEVIGKKYKIPNNISEVMAQEVALEFWKKDKTIIKDILEENVYIGLTKQDNWREEYSYYIPSIKVKREAIVPNGFIKERIESCLCMRVRYIGRHHYYEINASLMQEMYKTIGEFIQELHDEYIMPGDIYFEQIDSELYDGEYCQLEWYTPIYKI